MPPDLLHSYAQEMRCSSEISNQAAPRLALTIFTCTVNQLSLGCTALNGHGRGMFEMANTCVKMPALEIHLPYPPSPQFCTMP